MPIASIAYELKDRLEEPGCPICQVAVHSAERFVKHLHWWLINDGSIRESLLRDWGYCPQHTQLVAYVEAQMFGDWLGTNILFQALDRHIAAELAQYQVATRASTPLRRILDFFVRRLHLQPEIPRSVGCDICRHSQFAAASTLSALLEEIQIDPERWQPLYLHSDGLCLSHLLQALQRHAEKWPSPVQWVLANRIELLHRQADAMEEYALKCSWDRRLDEKTEEELHAWQHSLAFLSGYPASALLPPGQDTGKRE